MKSMLLFHAPHHMIGDTKFVTGTMGTRQFLAGWGGNEGWCVLWFDSGGEMIDSEAVSCGRPRRCYDQGNLGSQIDYRKRPKAPLTDDHRWIEDLLMQLK